MRVTGGEFCGRILKVPKTAAVRPTQDRVRQALFNIIQTEIAGADFLDLFSGSGAVGIEALSRGANSAAFVEASRRHMAVLKENLKAIGLDRRPAVDCICCDAYRWIAAYSGKGFTVAFADPPYALGEERGYASVLNTLAERGVIREGGLFIAEMTAVQKAEETPGWELLRDREYGKTRLCVWRRAGNGGAG
jgi:16S rRNA (guanine966-N2)-methyltransferase